MFQRDRHQRQQPRIVPDYSRQPLQERRDYVMPLQAFRDTVPVDDKGENVGLGVHLGQGFKHLFAPAHAYQPVVNDRDPQGVWAR